MINAFDTPLNKFIAPRPINLLLPYPQPREGAFSYVVDLSGRFLWTQPQLCRVLRRSLEDLRGQDSSSIMRPGEDLQVTAPEVVEVHREALANPSTAIPFSTYIAPFGKRIYLVGTASFDPETHGGAFFDWLSYDLDASGEWARSQSRERFRAQIREVAMEVFNEELENARHLTALSHLTALWDDDDVEVAAFARQLSLKKMLGREPETTEQQPLLLDVPAVPKPPKHSSYTTELFSRRLREYMDEICVPWGPRLTVKLVCEKMGLSNPDTLKRLLRDYGYGQPGETASVTLKRLKREWYPHLRA
jgi:hypothetical protein